ncbi:GNAT family N-acetyltransferase [Pseudoalteromonas sp. T1lg23B]|uniref:GNAT family N-acetyltransferase n=1 Tax=Pseudoalteromonas sp. T1lg23B TaxID=2077097 RepID=UPI000CF6F6FD|nr:GNAT family N-acetyltransferase [Pseudoalteromonas sp. T1lg23B]
MEAIEPTDSHILQLMTWFNNSWELQRWAGPNFRYPFDLPSFKEDLRVNEQRCLALLSPQGELLAFGQYYLRSECCHLARLAVSPMHRGKGLVNTLLSELCKRGLQSLQVQQCSLFVYPDNLSAIKAYERFGFKQTQYFDDDSLQETLYMRKDCLSDE